MRTIQRFASRLASDDRGASLVEYGLLVGLLAVASVTAISTLAGDIGSMFSRIGGELDKVVTAPAK